MTKALLKKMGGFELVKEITFNIFESKEVDLMENQEQKKRKRKIDDYDYEDDFIEPFEGEDELVDIECKLENFFIYKGEMKQTPKRIISTYRNRIKKKGNKKEEKTSEEVYEKKTCRANVNDDIKVQIEAAVGFSLDDEEDETPKKPKRKRVRNRVKIVKEKDDKEKIIKETVNLNDNVLPVMNGTLIKGVGPSSNDFIVPQHAVNSIPRSPLYKPEEIEQVFYLKKSLIKKNPNLIHPMIRTPMAYNPYNNRPLSKSEEGMIMNEHPTHFFSSSPNLDMKKQFRSENEFKNFKRNDFHRNEQQDLLKIFGASSPNHGSRRVSESNAKEKNLQPKIKSNQETVFVNENTNTKQQNLKSNQETIELNDVKKLKKLELIIIEPVKENTEVDDLKQPNIEPIKRKYMTRSKHSTEEITKKKLEISEMINLKVQEMSHEFLKEVTVNQPTIGPVAPDEISNQPVYGPMKELSEIATEQIRDSDKHTDLPNTVIKIKNVPELSSTKLSKKISKKPGPKPKEKIPPIFADSYSESVVLVEEVSSPPISADAPPPNLCSKMINTQSSSILLRYYLKCKMETIETKLNDPITQVFFFYFNLIANEQSSEDYVIKYSLLENHCSPKTKENDDYTDPKNLFDEEALKNFEIAVDEHSEKVMARLKSFSENPNMYNPTKNMFFGFENDSFIKNSIVFLYLICCREVYKGLNYKKAFEHAKGLILQLFSNDVNTLKFVKRITVVLKYLLKENTLV